MALTASILLPLIWPEPYTFRVSQSTFEAWELVDGEYVPLDDFQTGYKKLDAFYRRCSIAVFFSGVGGWSLCQVDGLIVLRRSFSMAMMAFAAIVSTVCIVVTSESLPETLDPVYGSGGIRIFTDTQERIMLWCGSFVYALIIGCVLVSLLWLGAKLLASINTKKAIQQSQ